LLLRFLLVSCAVANAAVRPALAADVTLQDEFLLVAFDADSGALTRLEYKTCEVLAIRLIFFEKFRAGRVLCWPCRACPRRRFNDDSKSNFINDLLASPTGFEPVFWP
jgi:hypothetical protein